MITRREALAVGTCALTLVLATITTPSPAEDAAPGDGTSISAQVPSLLELSLAAGGPTAVVARVTTTVPHVALLAGAPGRSRTLARWPRAVTGARVLVHPAKRTTATELVVTAAVQTP